MRGASKWDMVCLLCGTGRTLAVWPQEIPPARVRVCLRSGQTIGNPIEISLRHHKSGSERQSGPISLHSLADLATSDVHTDRVLAHPLRWMIVAERAGSSCPHPSHRGITEPAGERSKGARSTPGDAHLGIGARARSGRVGAIQMNRSSPVPLTRRRRLRAGAKNHAHGPHGATHRAHDGGSGGLVRAGTRLPPSGLGRSAGSSSRVVGAWDDRLPLDWSPSRSFGAGVLQNLLEVVPDQGDDPLAELAWHVARA
jgi:hypothetical protein